jgi:putative ABC transport system ATP-binding protein
VSAPWLLGASELAKTYRRGAEDVRALAGASLHVAAGELVTLIGPSGSGKTTLLSVLAGWEHPDAGAIVWRGAPLPHPETLTWSDVAVVPQTLGLLEELSIRENVELPLRLGPGADGRVRAGELLETLGLSGLADRLPDEVSLGEQQRAAVARALVLEPAFLIADEPTGHQDAGWTRGVLDVLRVFASGGGACLVATHHKAFVRFADRVLAIGDGQVRQVDADEAVGSGEEL